MSENPHAWRRTVSRRTLGGLFLATPAIWPAAAQTRFPDRPVTLVLPTGAGGPADLTARVTTEAAAAALGQPVVVDNRVGAGGILGTRSVIQAAPDGHTLVVNAAGPMTISPWLVRDLGYDPLTALAPITRLSTGPLLVVVNPRLPWRSMADIVEEAKRRPGAINYATAGIGTVPHLATEMFATAAGIRMEHVIYRSAPAATQSVMQGETALFFDSPASLQHVRAGTLRGLAVTTAQRFSLMPDIPTVAEAGGPEVVAEAWYGLLAPAQTPRDRIAHLHSVFSSVVRRPEIAQRLAAISLEPVGDSPEEFTRFLAAESARWRDLIRAAQIRAE